MCVCVLAGHKHEPTGGSLHCHHQEASAGAFPRKHWLFSKWFQCEERQDTEVQQSVYLNVYEYL